MDNFEPKIEHFFLLLASEDVSEELRNHSEYLEEALYYTGAEQKNTVLNAFQSAENKAEIFRGLGALMPLSSDLIKYLLEAERKNLKEDTIVEIYRWLQDIGTPIVNYTKRLRNFVDNNRILSPYETRSKEIEKTLADLHNRLSELEELNKQYAGQKMEQEKLRQQIAQLQDERREGYWEQKEQELRETQMQLERAKTKYADDCKHLEDLQKELDAYQSGAVSESVAKYLRNLRRLSQELPKDEVN